MEGEHLDRLAEDIEANGLHEPTAFVLSANVHRRNLSTGQRAMAVAMLYPEQTSGGRGKKNRPDMVGLARQRIGDARAVLNYSPELAQAVMQGEKPLQAALGETRSTGQRAMAMLSPEPEQGKRTDITTSGEVRISQQRLSDARAVLLGGVNRARTMLAFANRFHSRTT